MCLAIPGKIVSVENGPPPSARVDFEGLTKTVSLLYVPDAAVGEYVIVQAGFAIRIVAAEDAQEALALARGTTIDGASTQPTSSGSLAASTEET